MTHSISNNTVYASTTFTVLGNTWQVIKAFGKHNYLTIVKKTNSPFTNGGKTFTNFCEAAKSYKSPAMKTALLMAEIEMESYFTADLKRMAANN